MGNPVGLLVGPVTVLAVVATAIPAGPQGIVVTTDRSVNCATLETIVADVCRGCRSDKEKAIAIYNFVVRMMWIPYVYDQPKEMIDGRLTSVTDALKNLNVYGAGGCGIQSVVFSTLLKAAGIPERQLAPGFAHITNEVQWDGKWHYMDTWLPLYLTDEKGEIYSYDELMADRSLAAKAVEAGRHSENFMYNPEADVKAFANAKGFRPLASGAGKVTYREDLCLRPGESVTWLWDNVGKWYWPGEQFSCPAFKFSRDQKAKLAFPYWEPYRKSIKGGPHPWSDMYYRYHGNAIFVSAPPLTRAGLAGLGAKTTNIVDVKAGVGAQDPAQPATIEIAFALPYVIADSEISARAAPPPGGAALFEYSLDGGKSWRAAKGLTEGRPVAFSIGRPNSREYPEGTTSGQYGYLLRITLRPGKGPAALNELKVTNVTMLNFYSRPWLEVGKNKLAVTARDGEALARWPLDVTWRWLEDWTEAKHFTHQVTRSGAEETINVGGSKRPKMESVTIACPAR